MYKTPNKTNTAHQSAANTAQSSNKSNYHLEDNRNQIQLKSIIQRIDSDDEKMISESDDESDFMDEGSNSDYDYNPPSEEEFDSDEIFRESGKSYRSGRSFYTGKIQDTRKNLIKRQTDSKGNLRSGFAGDGPIINLDAKGREIRSHKKKSTKNKQPDIDHIIDFLVIDDEIDRYDDSDLSSDEREEFKNYSYNVESNLEILSKKIHKDKKRYTRDNIPPGLRKKANAFVKAQRKKFKEDKLAQDRLEKRRKKNKK